MFYIEIQDNPEWEELKKVEQVELNYMQNGRMEGTTYTLGAFAFSRPLDAPVMQNFGGEGEIKTYKQMNEAIIMAQNGDDIANLINTALEVVKVETISYVLIKFNSIKLFVKKNSTFKSVYEEAEKRAKVSA